MRRKRKKIGIEPGDFLSAEQVDLLLKYARMRSEDARLRHLKRGIVGAMLIELMLNTGLRASEVCDLRLGDLPSCHGKPMIWVRDGKGGRSQAVEIPPAFVKKLNAYVLRYRQGSAPNGWLFLNERGRRMQYRSLWSMVKTIGRAVGMEWLAPHKLRHTYACHLRAVKGDLGVVQRQLRHANSATTEVYARVFNKQVREQISALPWAR